MTRQSSSASAVKGTWSPSDIRAELVRRRITITSIAKELHVGHQAICAVIIGRCRTPYIRQRIADAIGVEVTTIWPDTAGCDMTRRYAPKRQVS